MSKRVIWNEGMLLSPQHLQLHEEYSKQNQTERINQLMPFSWGHSNFNLNHVALANRTIEVFECRGCFDDGTVFNAPCHDELPSPIKITGKGNNMTIFLGIPLAAKNQAQVSRGNRTQPLHYRYLADTVKVKSQVAEDDSLVDVNIAKLKLTLLTSEMDLSQWITLPMVKLLFVNSDDCILLDNNFIPPLLTVTFQQTLMKRLKKLLKGLCEQIKQQQETSSDKNVQNMLIRYHSALFSMSNLPVITPWDLHFWLLQLKNELDCFLELPFNDLNQSSYDHINLSACCLSLMKVICTSIQELGNRNSNYMRFHAVRNHWWKVNISADYFTAEKQFIIGINSELSLEEIDFVLAHQWKMGAESTLTHQIARGLPGLAFEVLADKPPSLAHSQQQRYLRLQPTQSTEWDSLSQSDALWVYCGANGMVLQLTLWVIDAEVEK